MAVANIKSRTRFVRALVLATVVSGAVPLTAQLAAPAKPDSSFLVELGRAGAFEVGMTVDEAQAIVGVQNTKLVAEYGEGMFGAQLQIMLGGLAGHPGITAPISDFPCGVPALNGLLIHDPRFKTRRGIGVGSTLADIRKYQPSARISNFGADGGPGVFDAEPGTSFFFANATASRDSARVTSLWVHSAPNARGRRCPRDADWALVFQSALTDVVLTRFAKSGGERPPVILIGETKPMCDVPHKPLDVVGCLERSRTSAPFLNDKLADDFYGRNSGQAPVPLLDGADAVITAVGFARLVPPDSRRLIVRFSSPGFDNGRAAVFVSYSCGSRCGESLLVLLELRDGNWKVASVQPLSVS